MSAFLLDNNFSYMEVIVRAHKLQRVLLCTALGLASTVSFTSEVSPKNSFFHNIMHVLKRTRNPLLLASGSVAASYAYVKAQVSTLQPKYASQTPYSTDSITSQNRFTESILSKLENVKNNNVFDLIGKIYTDARSRTINFKQSIDQKLKDLSLQEKIRRSYTPQKNYIKSLIDKFTNNNKSLGQTKPVLTVLTSPSAVGITYDPNYYPQAFIKEIAEVSIQLLHTPSSNPSSSSYTTVVHAQQHILQHRIIARINYEYTKDECNVEYINTFSAKDRNKGYASLLLLELENEMRQKNIYKIKLRAMYNSVNFYKKRGFTEEEEPSYLTRMVKVITPEKVKE